MTPDTKPRKPSPDEQENLDRRLIDAAWDGRTEMEALLLSGANVHVGDDLALRWAAGAGHSETVKVLLAAGADVHARDDYALRSAACNDHTETVRVLAKHLLAPKSWRGKSRAEIEAQAGGLYEKIKAENIPPEHLRQVGAILIDCALRCWEQVRPAPPPLKISPLPAQPRFL